MKNYYFGYEDEQIIIHDNNFKDIFVIETNEKVSNFIQENNLDINNLESLEDFFKTKDIIEKDSTLYNDINEFDKELEYVEKVVKLKSILKSLNERRFNLKIGERSWRNLIVSITELIWARNYYDGYLIDVYDKSKNYIGTIKGDGETFSVLKD